MAELWVVLQHTDSTGTIEACPDVYITQAEAEEYATDATVDAASAGVPHTYRAYQLIPTTTDLRARLAETLDERWPACSPDFVQDVTDAALSVITDATGEQP